MKKPKPEKAIPSPYAPNYAPKRLSVGRGITFDLSKKQTRRLLPEGTLLRIKKLLRVDCILLVVQQTEHDKCRDKLACKGHSIEVETDGFPSDSFRALSEIVSILGTTPKKTDEDIHSDSQK